MSPTTKTTITPVHVADLRVGEGQWMPLFVHLIDHPEARILVDTGLTRLHPLVADMDPQIRTSSLDRLAPEGIDMIVNTHLHYDHCGGNHRYPGIPIYVQRQEFLDATPDHTITEWVHAPGVEYYLLDGERQLLPGIRLIPGPGHTRGSQFVVVDSDDGPVVIAGDLAVSSEELDHPSTEGQRRVRALDPHQVWLSHQTEPWRPSVQDPFLPTAPRQARPGSA